MGSLEGKKVGLIGIGFMGAAMAGRLLKAGAELTVFNRSAEKMTPLVGAGAVAAAGSGDLAARVGAGTIIICVSDTEALEMVIEGVLASLAPGTLVIDMGTSAVAATRLIAGRVAAAGGRYVDAPVSGGEAGAQAGTLTIMAGGDEADIDRARPVFDILGSTLTHIGAVGAGQVAKTVNQVIVAMTLDAVAEGLVLAAAAGVDQAVVREALLAGFAQSRVLDLHGQRMIERDFEPGGRSWTQLKDIRLALDLAGESKVTLPGLERVGELWAQMCDSDMGELDQSGIYRLIEGYGHSE